jgi:transposase InsO family protein
MHREGLPIARCTVQRLMRKLGLKGARRGKKVRTTRPDAARPCPLDLVNRQFTAQHPDQLWVADFTYVSTWQGQMFVAFVIDVYARRIVGWRVSSHMRTDFVVDALEQALYARRPSSDTELIHHSDRGSQYGSSLPSFKICSSAKVCNSAPQSHQMLAPPKTHVGQALLRRLVKERLCCSCCASSTPRSLSR